MLKTKWLGKERIKKRKNSICNFTILIYLWMTCGIFPGSSFRWQLASVLRIAQRCLYTMLNPLSCHVRPITILGELELLYHGSQWHLIVFPGDIIVNVIAIFTVHPLVKRRRFCQDASQEVRFWRSTGCYKKFHNLPEITYIWSKVGRVDEHISYF